MNRFRMTSIALSLGLLATGAYADDGWAVPSPRPAAAPAAAQLGRPVVVPTSPSSPGSGGVPGGAAAPAALLDRPLPLAGADAMTDGQVRPASYGASPFQPSPETGGGQGRGPLFRGQAPDAKPMPTGPAAVETAPMPHNWQRPSPDQVVVGAPPATVLPGGPAPADCGDSCCGGCNQRPFWSMFRRWGAGLANCCGCGDCGDGACCDGAACDGSCDAACAGCPCPPGNRFYVSAEYLLWWTKGDPLPPLVTLGSPADFGLPGVIAGALDRPGTSILFGGKDVNDRARSGARVMAGWWFGDEHLLGVEGGGFILGSQTTTFTATSLGDTVIARPFFDTRLGIQNVEFVGEPGIPGRLDPLGGTVRVSDKNTFWGAEANLRSNLWCGCGGSVDAIVGYRHLSLEDTLTVNESLRDLAVGTVIGVNDTFRARNNFDGGQVGFDAELRRNRWSLDLKAKIALGEVSQRVDIFGSTVINGVASNGGLLAQPTNSGPHSRNRFAWSPDVGLNLGYQLTDHVRAFVGYDFLYLSDVARAGKQVDLNVNSLQLVRPPVAGGSASPAFTFQGSDFWAQGVSLGLEFRY